MTLISENDVYLFNEGSNYRAYEKLGAHPDIENGMRGTHFAVWAPDADRVSVIGDFNRWDGGANVLYPQGQSGIWAGFIPGIGHGAVYKYHIESKYNGYKIDKADPFSFKQELPPRTASAVWDMSYQWGDAGWMSSRSKNNSLQAPISIYEMHLGSWMRIPDEGRRWMTYRELAEKLPAYIKEMGFTHVEFLPVMEHPFYGSWGYQTTGYFAPTSRYGNPQDLMYLVDTLHQNSIGVILDWVPSHFPTDDFALGFFDGTHLYEHGFPQKGFHPDWSSYIFNYGRHEVRSFLMSSALFWLDKYHADGLRVDAVASMLYLDYSRRNGDWMPNQFGGRENLEAIDFLKRLNEEIYKNYPDVQTYAEESTSWPMVSRPVHDGGLGFGMKWDMGWMHDMLEYISLDPIHRKFQHDKLTFRMLYSFLENFVLPLSHDEVVHSKGSLLGKMPGDNWQKFANLRLLYGYMFGQPGKKLLFMGAEFAQWNEWYHETSLDWHLLEHAPHKGVQHWVKDVAALYRHEPALHEIDFEEKGFQWINCRDGDNSAISFIRRGLSTSDIILGVFNFTPVPRAGYHIGVPAGGNWQEVLNSDATDYYGSGIGNLGGVKATSEGRDDQPYSITVTLPPLSALFFKHHNQ